MYFTEYVKQESYQSWQPPKSLQIIPFERIESCPPYYTPESLRKPCKIERIQTKRPYIHKPRYIEQYRDNSHSKPLMKKTGREDVVACFIIKRK